MHKDCLNTIRLLAALQVALCNHAVTHLHLGTLPPMLSCVLNFFSGIPVFFTLSGFLIWQSIDRSPSFGNFCGKRFWRIYPELWVAVVFELVVLLLLYRHPVNWLQVGLFAIGQGTVFPFWVPVCLRDYGCGTPNGALWSIFALVQFYVLSYPLHRLLKNRGLSRWSSVMLGLVLLSIGFRFLGKYLPMNMEKLLAISFVPTIWMFVLGAMVSEFRTFILPGLVRFWYVPVTIRVFLMFVSVPDIPVFYYGFLTTISVFASALAVGYRFPMLNIPTDISYGVYIYHMTVVNAMIALSLSGGGLGKLVVVGIVVCALSWVSTVTIGSYSKNLKKRFSMAGANVLRNGGGSDDAQASERMRE